MKINRQIIKKQNRLNKVKDKIKIMKIKLKINKIRNNKFRNNKKKKNKLKMNKQFYPLKRKIVMN